MALRHEPQSLLLDRHGRVVIPASLRRVLNLKPGDRLVAWVEKDRLIVRPRAELVRDLRARFRRRPGEDRLTQTLRRMRDEELRS
ncbi:MAG: AbrB/MazE/SpoVT family DNA-binding domain-containing protein [Acidobacteria bacterium]|nr:AbrB/MazE/SpoVT family DNA-binding domain-containing protein [Acidobacteriota bacterium]